MKKLILAATLALATSPASAALIDFEGFANGTIITNQYAGVTFSSVPGQTNQITTQPGIRAVRRRTSLCTATSSNSTAPVKRS